MGQMGGNINFKSLELQSHPMHKHALPHIPIRIFTPQMPIRIPTP